MFSLEAAGQCSHVLSGPPSQAQLIQNEEAVCVSAPQTLHLMLNLIGTEMRSAAES